ncbi:hypothetical protein [Photobacterium galatheae]|nr:hypothetical protein [Photobacterium galatheae]MCM0149236.1 hypothetical protein [Photobacterium galatheae]
MKKIRLISALGVLAFSGYSFASQSDTHEAILDSKNIDILNGQEHYWKKLSGIESAKNQVIQLQIQNKNLQKSAGMIATGTSGSSSAESALNEVNTLQEFLDLSLMHQAILKPEEAGDQAEIISANSEVLAHNIEIAGTVDARGNAVGEPKDKGVDVSKIQKEQQKFFEQMADFLNAKFSDIESKIQQTPVMQSQLEPQVDSEVDDVPSEEVPQEEEAIKFDYQSSFESPFYKPVGKIKKVTPSGVEVVMVYEWKDYDEDTVFATTVIKKGDKEAIFYPMIRHIHQYKIVEFSESKIKLLDANDEEIIITR